MRTEVAKPHEAHFVHRVALNVGKLEELALVNFDPALGTRVIQPEPLPAEETFRVVRYFDAERGSFSLPVRRFS